MDRDIFFTAKNEELRQLKIKCAVELTCRELCGFDPYPRGSGVAGNHQRSNAREQSVFFAEGGDHSSIRIVIRSGQDTEIDGKSICLKSVFCITPDGGHQYDLVDRRGLRQFNLHPFELIRTWMVR